MGVLHWRYIQMFVTVLSVPVIQERRDSAVYVYIKQLNAETYCLRSLSESS